MKNIQIVDGAENCVFDIFQATEEEFSVIFPEKQDIGFIDEIEKRLKDKKEKDIFGNIWKRRIRKKDALGIHGTLFFELDYKKKFYPTRIDEEAVNPDGTRLRN